MTRKITWTEKQQQARDMLDKGMADKDILAADIGQSTLTRVKAARKAELAEKKRQEQERTKTDQNKPGGSPQVETKIKGRTLEEVQVGSFLVTPGDWRINQYGLFLILNTHDQAKQKFGYEGTIGEFLCDAVQMVRKIMGLDLMEFQYFIKEGDNGTGTAEEASEGGGVSQEGGNETDGGKESGEIA